MKVCLRSSGFDYDWHSLVCAYSSYVSPDDSVLEIGASIPGRSRELGLLCASVTGVDIDPERLPVDTGNVRYLVGDWQHLTGTVGRSSIDVAVASHVLEHVADDRLALDELYAVLKPGGVAFINTPNRKRLTRAVIERLTGERAFPWWEHQREYTERDLSALLESSRFERFEIKPLVLGIHGGPLFIYSETVFGPMRKYANYLEAHLFKGDG